MSGLPCPARTSFDVSRFYSRGVNWQEITHELDRLSSNRCSYSGSQPVNRGCDDVGAFKLIFTFAGAGGRRNASTCVMQAGMLTPGEEDKARAVLLEIASGHDAQTRSAVLPNDAKSLEEGLNGPLSELVEVVLHALG